MTKPSTLWRTPLQRAAGRCEAAGKPEPNTFPSGMAELTVGHDGRARYSAGICWDLVEAAFAVNRGGTTG